MESNAHIVEYWKTQPEVLEACLKNSLPLTENFVKLYKEVSPTHLYLVGSGTSLNAEETAVSFMKEMLDIDVISMPSSYVHNIRGERPLLVFLSQGGSSTNTLKAMEEMAAYPYITVTGEETCEIAARSPHHMIIGCGEEPVATEDRGLYGVGHDPVLDGHGGGEAVGIIGEERYAAVRAGLLAGISHMRYNMEAISGWAADHKEKLKEIEKYIFIGHGTGAAALKEGCLKVLETIKYPAFSYEFEEYLHYRSSRWTITREHFSFSQESWENGSVSSGWQSVRASTPNTPS